MLAGKTLAQAIAEVVALAHVDELGRSRTLFPRTLYRWVQAHAKAGLAALEDQPRPRIADSQVLALSCSPSCANRRGPTRARRFQS